MLGTPTSVAKFGGTPPVFADAFTMAGDSAYAAGGTTGLQAKLRALRGDSRTVISARGHCLSGGAMKTCHYDPVTDKLICVLANGTEESAGDISANVYTITAFCV